MEGNRDEAEKCIKLAVKFLEHKNTEKGIKFLEKSIRLYPTDKAQRLLQQIQNLNSNNGSDGDEGESAPNGATRDRSRSRSTGHQNGTSERPSYSQQTSADDESTGNIRRVLRNKEDYYKVLDVSKDCSDDDLKKSYKKLAFQLHPDKNQSQGANEAFKVVSAAYTVLSDSEKRRQYDLSDCGPTIINGARRRNNRHYADEVDPEELFNMFFGGAFTNHTVHRHNTGNRRTFYTTRNTRTEVERDANYVWVQILPILALFAVSILSSFFVSDPAFQMSRSQKYPIERTTQRLRVPYYVKSDFHSTYAGSIPRLERQVEDDYIHNLQVACYREKSNRENLYFKAQYLGRQDLYEQARQMSTPSCNTLNDVYGTA